MLLAPRFWGALGKALPRRIAAMESGSSLKYFNGDDCDWKEYKRWKQWATNKMRVMEKLPKESRGSFIWTLLQGRALETVEHLKEEEYQREGGDKVIFDLLDQRWPEKDSNDVMGEVIAEVFAMKGRDGETLRQWAARARETFDRCNRKCSVNFPEQARGWVLLNCSGLLESERAVVLARAQGDLKFDSIATAMRSCYPEMTISRKRASAAHVVMDEDPEIYGKEMPSEPDLGSGFEDVELLLAEHGLQDDQVAEEWEEQEAAEVLAASWKDKRAELNRLQKSRKFQQANDLRRAFRVEVGEVKSKMKCHRCHQLGHFARECRNRPVSSGASGSSAKGKGREHAASAVEVVPPPEHFVCSAGCDQGDLLLDHEILLVSSPGFAVLDSGCGKTIVGAETLKDFVDIWHSHGIAVPDESTETNVFKYGNGEREVSHRMIDMPVVIAGRRGIVKAAVVRGKAPLLLSRLALKTLKASMDFASDELQLFGERVPMAVNEAGQYIIKVSDFPGPSPMESPHAVPREDKPEMTDASDASRSHLSEQEPNHCASVKFNFKRDKPKDYWEIKVKERVVVRHHRKPRTARFTPCHTQCPISVSDLLPNRCTRVVPLSQKEEYQVCDQWTNSHDAHAVECNSQWKGSTSFAIAPHVDLSSYESVDEHEVHLMQWSPKQHRSLLDQIRQGVASKADASIDVVEVFSPPRFGLECEKLGLSSISADLCTGWDFRKASDRQIMRDIVKTRKPRLLTLSPPCTWAGGWFHLNKYKMSPEDVREKTTLTRLFISFCKQLIEIQLANGGRVLFEHPKDSVAWHLLKSVEERLLPIDVHMCQYGLRLPGGALIRKPTKLPVSHDDMKCLSRICPGQSDPDHRQHAVIAGSYPNLGPISKFAGRYPPAFVKAVLQTIPEVDHSCEVLQLTGDDTHVECLAANAVDELNEDDLGKLKQSLKKLHQNLGHPPNAHLVRILKHGGASTKALQLAKDFSCEQCIAQAPPRLALPTQTQRVTVFNAVVGIDVKYLDGWSHNQKIPALNIVDYASSMQMMIPIFKKESSEVIRHAFMERWVSWAGMPTEIVCDPAKHVADALTVPLEQQGTTVKITAGDAHWQLGKVEVHGGWFNRVLKKTISELAPQNQSQWLECVHAAHCKNQLIQVYGMTPSQFVFGANPRIPENLLDEPLEVIPATASLYQDAIARQVKIRQAARRAVLDLQDCKSLRLALAARPRVTPVVTPGQYVAYWRSQKWIQGQLKSQGAWYGPAIVLGHVGRNVVIIHKRQIFRCAPEQVRPSTDSEKQLAETPHLELTGIKNLIDQGALSSKQYIDLVPESYPSENPEAPTVPNSPDVATAPGPQSLADEQPVPSTDSVEPQHAAEDSARPEPTEAAPDAPMSEEKSDYGPVRRRLAGKHGPMTLYRPGRMSQDDFSDMMQEVVPQLLEQVLGDQPPGSSGSSSSRAVSSKRSADDVEHVEESQSKAIRTSSPERSIEDEELLISHDDGHTFAKDEVTILSVQHQSELPRENLSDSERLELAGKLRQGVPVDVLLAEYMKKKMAKEIRGTGNPPELQSKVDEAKLLEWNTILAKNAARVVYGAEAAHARAKMNHRIMGSRYVMTIKQEDDAPERVKARWCLQGHLDPDLSVKASSGDLQSPTLSQVARNMIFQLIASHKWRLKLGDIKGAFLSAGDLPPKYRPLYASLPQGGIPGIPSDALIEVVGHVYGLNDSPSAWFKRLSSILIQAGFERSRFDSCLFYMRDGDKLTGIYGVHVDDCATAGFGEKYDKALAFLQSEFEFRKWRDGQEGGDFCGATYTQDPKTFDITMSQQKFIQKIRPMHFSKERMKDRDAKLNEKEVSCLRAINGSLNWLATQSRPDLSTQVSFSQQSFPDPTVADALAANNAVRRAKQHADQEIRFCSISPSDLAVMCQSDAAFGNAKSGATQAGYIVGITHKDINKGTLCPWSPVFWKSARLPRVVSSTLSAEAQSMAVASSMCEWITLLISEALDGPRFSHSCWNHPNPRPVLIGTDCKSLYDHLHSPSSPTLEDRRTAIDIIILRDSIIRLGASLRWLPTNRMLADALTKESPEAFDLIRACLRSSQYQISPEESILELRAAERDRRQTFAQKSPATARE